MLKGLCLWVLYATVVYYLAILPTSAWGIRCPTHLPDFAGVVHVAVLPEHLAVGELGLDLEGAVRALVAVAVGAVLVVPVDLLEDGHGRGLRLAKTLALAALAPVLRAARRQAGRQHEQRLKQERGRT